MEINAVKIGFASEQPLPLATSVGGAGVADLGRHVVGQQAGAGYPVMSELISGGQVFPRGLQSFREGERIATLPVGV